MRIIGGRWKRTPIVVPDSPGLRPTPDRVRETLFNWLAHLRPDFAALRVLDLYAGTGALGFEAASRGAARVLAIESQPALVARLQALQRKLGADTVEIRRGDALAQAALLAPATFDLVLLDPPFDAGLHAAALAAARPLLASGGLVYYESPQGLTDAEAAQQGWQVVRAARAGRVAFHLLSPGAA